MVKESSPPSGIFGEKDGKKIGGGRNENDDGAGGQIHCEADSKPGKERSSAEDRR